MQAQEQLEMTLQKALDFENEDKIDEALDCYRQSLEKFPANQGQILFQMASFLFRSGNYVDALRNLVKSYNTGYQRVETEKTILEAYYEPNKQTFFDTFIKNVEFLSNYSLCNIEAFPGFASLSYRFIPFSETQYTIFDNNKKLFISDIELAQPQPKSGYNDNTVLLIKNEFNAAKLSIYEEDTRNRNTNSYVTTSLPLYLVYEDQHMFCEFLQVSPFHSLLENERFVFLFGVDQVNEWFNSETAVFPTVYLNMSGKEDRYYVSIEQLKQKLTRNGNIGYQNLMLIFNQSFKTK